MQSEPKREREEEEEDGESLKEDDEGFGIENVNLIFFF